MSHTSQSPVSKYSTANLPTTAGIGAIAYDTDKEQLVFFESGGFWNSLGGAGVDALTDTYIINATTNEIKSISGDVPQDWASDFASLDFQTLIVGSSAETIGKDAFNRQFYAGYEFTGNLNIPIGVKYIKQGAFFSNDFTGKLILPEGLIEIESYGLGFLSEMDAGTLDEAGMIIPSSVTSIDAYAFTNNVIKRIDCYAPKYAFKANSLANTYSLQTIHVPINDTTFTAGPNQTVGNKTGLEIIKDL
jgi:hypothetical protein